MWILDPALDAVSLDSVEGLDLAGTLPSPPGPGQAAPERPLRVVVPHGVSPPARVAIQKKVERPSIFDHQSPGSAPTQVRDLAPPGAPDPTKK